MDVTHIHNPAVTGAGGRWVVNVTVHGIGAPARPLDDGEDQVWISVEQFEGLLDAAVGRPDVTVTFDDGNLSDLEIGLPRLLERGLKARFYIPAGLRSVAVGRAASSSGTANLLHVGSGPVRRLCIPCRGDVGIVRADPLNWVRGPYTAAASPLICSWVCSRNSSAYRPLRHTSSSWVPCSTISPSWST